MTIQFRIPVRLNAPQVFDYVFKDQDKNVIPLTGFLSVALHLKLQGAVEVDPPVAAAFLNPRSAGKVESVLWVPPAKGLWLAQFIAVDSANRKLPGEPLVFTVAVNVPDLGLNDTLPY